MNANERARAREKIRHIASTARYTLGELEACGFNDVLTELTQALDLMAAVSESQDRELEAKGRF